MAVAQGLSNTSVKILTLKMEERGHMDDPYKLKRARKWISSRASRKDSSPVRHIVDF